MMATTMLSSKASARAPAAFTSSSRSVAGAKAARRSFVITAAHPGKGGEEGGATFDKSVYGTVAKNANYMILGSLIAKAGLDKTLMDANSKFTLFAPDDDAFAAVAKKLGVTKLELGDIPNLAEILKNHVVSGEVLSDALVNGGEVATLGGNKLKGSAGPKVNGVAIKKKDIKVSNGIIHAVPEVLL